MLLSLIEKLKCTSLDLVMAVNKANHGNSLRSLVRGKSRPCMRH